MHLSCGVLILLLASAAAANDSLVSIGDPKYFNGNPAGSKVTYLRYPTLGCPSIVKQGSGGTARIRLADGGVTTGFTLSISPTRDPGGPSYALPVAGVTFEASTSIYKVAYQVPLSIPEETYDFKIAVPSQAVTDIQYNSFKVVAQESGDFRFVVIADSHYNYPIGILSPENYNPGNYTNYTILQQMKKEIRALNPTFVILMGDLTFGIDYDFEYDGAWNVWKDTGVPIFMIPGNHDAYTCVEDRWFLGLHSPVRDGLDYWRRTFGPCYYSFEFGGVHFQAVNSADGTPQRRDGFLFVIENYGGDLLSEQMNWIAADLAGVAGTVVPVLHHNPMGPYRPNGTFKMSSWVFNRLWDFLSTGTFETLRQVWNTQATGQFLLNQYAGVPLVFMGHEHLDEIKTHGSTTYKLVTTCGAPSQHEYWGYALVRVQNSQIAEYLYSSDPSFQSIPTGNLHVTVTDGEGSEQKAAVQSGLSKAYDVTVAFTMPAASGYSVSGGTIVQVAPVGNSMTRVWVRTPSPTAPGIKEPQSKEIVVSTAPVADSVESSSPAPSGGSSCGAPEGRGHAAGTLLLVLATGAILLLGSRRGRYTYPRS